MSKYVIGLDPGKTTGCVIYDLTCGDSPWEATELQYLQMCVWLEDRIQRLAPDVVVVCENFHIRQSTLRHTEAPWSLHGIGVGLYLAAKYGVAFQLQEVAAAKRFATDAKLKTLGWWKPGAGHANDASRHVLLYLVGHGWWHDSLVV